MTTETTIKTPAQLAEAAGVTVDAVRQALAKAFPELRFDATRPFSLAEADGLRTHFAERLNGSAAKLSGTPTELERTANETARALREATTKAGELETKLREAVTRSAEIATKYNDADRLARENAAKVDRLETENGELRAKVGEAARLEQQVETMRNEMLAKLAERQAELEAALVKLKQSSIEAVDALILLDAANSRIVELEAAAAKKADWPVFVSRCGLWAITAAQILLVLAGGFARWGWLGLAAAAVPCVFLVVANVLATDARFWGASDDGFWVGVCLAVVFGGLHYLTFGDVLKLEGGNGAWFNAIAATVIETVAVASLNLQIKISREK